MSKILEEQIAQIAQISLGYYKLFNPRLLTENPKTFLGALHWCLEHKVNLTSLVNDLVYEAQEAPYLVCVLLLTGEDIQDTDFGKHTVISEKDSLEMIKCLLELGALPDKEDGHGWSFRKIVTDYETFKKTRRDCRFLSKDFLEKAYKSL